MDGLAIVAQFQPGVSQSIGTFCFPPQVFDLLAEGKGILQGNQTILGPADVQLAPTG